MKYALLLLLLFSLVASAQDFEEVNIPGTWEIKKVKFSRSVASKETQSKMKTLFKDATITFNSDHTLDIVFTEGRDPEVESLYDAKSLFWKFENNVIQVGLPQDNYSDYVFRIRTENRKIFFDLYSMIFTVKKIADQPLLPFSAPQAIEESSSVSENFAVKSYEMMEVDALPLPRDCNPRLSLEERKKCMSAFVQRFIQRKFDTELAAQISGPSKYRVDLSFVINTDGSLINPEASGEHQLLNDEGIRVLSKLPNFKAGEIGGKKVPVKYTTFLIFQIAH